MWHVIMQVLMLKEMLSRGIGVHHGGLLPILKASRTCMHTAVLGRQISQ